MKVLPIKASSQDNNIAKEIKIGEKKVVNMFEQLPDVDIMGMNEVFLKKDRRDYMFEKMLKHLEHNKLDIKI